MHLFLVLFVYYGILTPTLHQNLTGKRLINAAFKRPVWMSSVHSVFSDVTKANDGDRRNDIIQACVHTMSMWYDTSPWRWWRVDCLVFHDIYNVDITNRGDCCGRRLKNFEIRIATFLNGKNYEKQDVVNEKVCCHHPSYVETKETFLCQCTNRPILGRYVTVLMPAQRDEIHREVQNGAPLHICEVVIHALMVLYFEEINNGVNWQYISRIIFRAGSPCGTSWISDWLCDFNTFCEPRDDSQERTCVNPIASRCTGEGNVCAKTSVCDRGSCNLDFGVNCNAREHRCRSSTTCLNGKCLIKLGEDCSGRAAKFCHMGICDRGRCRIPIGSTCNDTLPCVSGSSCKHSSCRCLKDISRQNNTVCEPLEGIVGGACTKGDTCSQRHSACNITNGRRVCQCLQNYTLHHEDFSCKIVAGQPCTNNDECRLGSKCDGRSGGKTCRLPLGERCIGPDSQYCIEGTTCDADHICKYDADQPCASNPSLCQLGSVCEDSNGTKLCKMDIGQMNCSGTSGENLCATKAICDFDNVCRLRTGEDCSGNDIDNCQMSAVCDTGYICRNKPGSSCGDGNPCKLGLVCEDSVCKLMPSVDCTNNELYCMEGFVCDQLKRCKLQKQNSCTASHDMCLTGAACVGTLCQCIATVSDMNSTLCKARARVPGGFCSNANTCMDFHGVCKEANSTCVCTNGYAISPHDLSCKLEPGANCSLIPDGCMAGTFCDSDKVCKLKLLENCAGEYGSYCQSGTVCAINGICLLSINSNCSGDAKDSCDVGKICDLSEKCKNPIHQYCNDFDAVHLCMAGARCIEQICQCNDYISTLNNDSQTCASLPRQAGGICNPDVRNDCEDPNAVCDRKTSTCQCYYPFAVSIDLSCKLRPGQMCGPDYVSCVSWTVCEENICKLILGSRCSESESMLCQSGTVCGVDLTCKLGLNADCTYQDIHCGLELVCDFSDRCRIPVKGECFPEEDMCVSGAYCSENKCVCATSEVAIESGSLCYPANGRIGGQCSVATSCHDHNAICDTSVSICTCIEGYFTDYRTYACATLSSPSKAGEDVTWPVLIGCVVAAMLATFAAVIVSVLRRREKREVVVEQERRRSLAISQLSQAAGVSEEPEETQFSSQVEETQETQETSEIESEAKSNATSESAVSFSTASSASNVSEEHD